MKKIYLVGGTMGVGKTAVCQSLKSQLENSVLLDGDWCWDMHPFRVTEVTKKLVMANISALLNNFIQCNAFDHIIFCWVMHQQAIIDEILGSLGLEGWQADAISLICSPEALQKRLRQDVEKGAREPDVLEKSQSYLPLYQNLHTRKIDTTFLTPQQVAQRIIKEP